MSYFLVHRVGLSVYIARNAANFNGVHLGVSFCLADNTHLPSLELCTFAMHFINAFTAFGMLVWHFKAYLACGNSCSSSLLRFPEENFWIGGVHQIYTVFRKKTPTHIFFHISMNYLWI